MLKSPGSFSVVVLVARVTGASEPRDIIPFVTIGRYCVSVLMSSWVKLLRERWEAIDVFHAFSLGWSLSSIKPRQLLVCLDLNEDVFLAL